MSRSRKIRHAIGVDFASTGIRMVQVAADGESLSIAAASRSGWPDEIQKDLSHGKLPTIESVSSIIKRMHRQGGFSGHDIALALPREIVQVKALRLPPMPTEELFHAAEFDLRQSIGIEESQISVRSVGTGEVRAGNEIKQEVLAVAVENRLIDELIEGWHAIGFIPRAIDFEASALFRTIERFIRRKDDESEVNVLLDVGYRRTQVIIGRGRQLIFYKPIEVGGWQFTHAVSRKLGITFEEASTLRLRLGQTAETVAVVGSDAVRQAVYDAVRPIVDHLAREVTTCLRYYSVNFRGQRPQRVRVVGGEAADPTVLAVLGGVLPVPVEAGKPLANADMSAMKVSDRSGPLAGWTLAFGLALHGAKGTFPDKLGISRAAQVNSIDAQTVASTPVPVATQTSTAVSDQPITDESRSQAYMEAGHDG